MSKFKIYLKSILIPLVLGGIVGFIIYMGVFIYFLCKTFKHTYRLKDNTYKICNYLSLSLIILLSLITGQSFNETICNILTLQGPEQLN